MVQAFEYVGNVSIIVVRFKRSQEECNNRNKKPEGPPAKTKLPCPSNFTYC